MGEQRKEFLQEFTREGARRREVCRAWRISPKTAYKWLGRWAEEGEEGLVDQPRRPKSSPLRTAPEVEALILGVRDENPAWGARKIARVLQNRGVAGLPAASTITEILRRSGRLAEEESRKRQAFERFERERPNELWQMDFKGHFSLGGAGRSHPLMVLDDHSRYWIGGRSCPDERGETVQAALAEWFREYGLPESMLMDNGSPWGNDAVHVYTPLVAWLIRLDIVVIHGRPRHPQTQGKLERLNRTADDELFRRWSFSNHDDVQRGLDWLRPKYNEERPHESLGQEVPASRYRPSERRYPEALPRIVYEEECTVRKVQDGGWLSYDGRQYRVAKAFKGYPVALKPTETDGLLDVYFCRQRIAVIDAKGGTARPVRR